VADRPTIVGGWVGDRFRRVFLVRRTTSERAVRHHWIPVDQSESDALEKGVERLEQIGLLGRDLLLEMDTILRRGTTRIPLDAGRYTLGLQPFSLLLDAAQEAGHIRKHLTATRDLVGRSSVRAEVLVHLVEMWHWRPDEGLAGGPPYMCCKCQYVGLPVLLGWGRTECQRCREYAFPLRRPVVSYGSKRRSVDGCFVHNWRPGVESPTWNVVVGKPLWDHQAQPLDRPQLVAP
jgi:hypothetical protein